MSRRSAQRAILAALCLSIGACSNFVAYEGAERPEREVATLDCYSRYYFVYLESCRFQAVDGMRPTLSQTFASTTKALPGPHWVEVAFESYFGGGGGVTDVCAFDVALEAGHAYRIGAHGLKTDIAHLAKHGHRGLYGATIDLEVAKPSGAREILRTRATCSFAGGSLCRKDEDCVPHPDIRCVPQQDFPFGACRLQDAPSRAR